MKKLTLILLACFVLFLNKAYATPIGSGPIAGGGGGGGAAGVEDDVYGAGWNGDTTNAPSQNAVYDKIETMVGGHNPVTLGTTNGLSLVGQQLSLAAATAATPGAATAAQIAALEAIDTEVELEAMLDLQDLQGAVTDAQVPNTITIDNINQITTRPASSIVFTPAGDVAAIDVQSAIAEVDSEKIPAIVSTDNQIVRFDGVGGDVQGSAATITDAGAITNATANADALVLGGAAAEGGNIAVYRDGAGNTQFTLDADAASNVKALDLYGGAVIQNYLTVGQAALNTTSAIFSAGDIYSSGTTKVYGNVYLGNGTPIIYTANNIATISTNIPVTGTDAIDHEVRLQIDSNTVIGAKATGDGAGGVEGLRSVQYGGQVVTKTDAGAANYNPSDITSDYIITVDTTAAARAVTISTEDVGTGSAANPRIFIIKDIAGNAAANNITVSLESGGTIDGAANYVINGNYNSITLMIDGTNGHIL